MTDELAYERRPGTQSKRRPKRKPANPISEGILLWLEALPQSIVDSTGTSSRDELREQLVEAAPKRWVVYHPMVLLPAGSFANRIWETVLLLLDEELKARLWGSVLEQIERREGGSRGAGQELTHFAVNEGIPATQRAGGRADGKMDGGGDDVAGDSGQGDDEVEREGEENVIRAPTNLRTLHGDFGPEPTAESRLRPTRDDFDRAFWVVTKQNGILQTWAPRYTMFSRGNVKEKARLLEFHERGDRTLQKGAFAADLYAGIGYFAFSYAKLGMRVLCWEINPWSVEALRRGAVMNGWTVRVARTEFLDDQKGDASEFVYGYDDETIVVFPESNQNVRGRVTDLVHSPNGPPHIVHVNCGLLPSSTPTWEAALGLVCRPEGWLHLHENVGIADIEPRRKEVQDIFDRWLAHDSRGRKAVVEHVEQVKTYAPGVWHCVFDVHVAWPETASTNPGIKQREDT